MATKLVQILIVATVLTCSVNSFKLEEFRQNVEVIKENWVQARGGNEVARQSLVRQASSCILNLINELKNSGDEVTVENLVALINSKHNNELLQLTADSIILNAPGVQAELQEGLNIILSKYITNENIKATINALVSLQINRLAPVLSSVKIPRSVVETLLTRLQNQIKKRAAGSILDVIEDVIRTEVGAILKPVQGVINNVFDEVIETLLLFYISSPPTGTLPTMVANITNNVVLKTVTIIGTAQNTFNMFFDGFLNPTRARRAIEDNDISEETAVSAGLLTNLLDIIMKPINKFLTGLVNGLSDSIGERIGKLIMAPLKNLLLAIIARVVPCSSC